MLLYVPKGRITVAMIFEQMSKDKFNEVCSSNFSLDKNAKKNLITQRRDV